jgi:hypothetical protein
VLAFALRDRSNAEGTARSRWARIAALTVALFTLAMITSQYDIQEHHLVTLIPEVAVLCAVTWVAIARRYRTWKLIGVGALVVYLGLAVYWNAVSIRHIDESGGRGYWSGAIDCAARYVDRRDHGQKFHVLDWGIRNGIYVLDKGRPNVADEWFLNAPRPFGSGRLPRVSARGLSWDDEVRAGGTYVLSAGANVLYPGPGQALREALRRQTEAGDAAFVAVGFADQLGMPAIVVVDIFSRGSETGPGQSQAMAAVATLRGPCSRPILIRSVEELDAFVNGKTENAR